MMKYLKNQVKRMFFKDRLLSRKNRRALEIWRHIQARSGKTAPALVKLADEYAADVLGGKQYAPWLYVYSAVQGVFKEGWIPDEYYARVVVPAVQGDHGKLADYAVLNGSLFKKEMERIGESFFPDIGYRINGRYYSTGLELVSADRLQSMLAQHAAAVFKLNHSLQGKGIAIIMGGTVDRQYESMKGDGVFQKYIRQHDFFENLVPGPVSTIRVTSCTDPEGNVSVRAAYLRIPRTSDTHVRSASAIKVPIRLSDGGLESHGFTPDFERTARHPDTHVLFENLVVPDFSKCVDVATRLHGLIPFVGSIGWDMIVDRDNKVNIMEWNGCDNDIKFSEATQGPCFTGLGWEQLWKQVKGG